MTKQKKGIDYFIVAKEDINISDYRIIKKIEDGNYAVVYRAKDKNNQDLILKVSRENILEFNELIAREFQILSRFQHPNIVPVFDFGTTKDGLSFFTLEYIRGKPINECFQKFSQEFLKAIIQVLNGIGAFHNKGFIHSDLKPEHILYNAEEKKCVIIDFGFAGVSTHRIKEYGTIGYVAPEVLKGIGFDQPSDLYSLGVIIYEILSGKRPVKPYKQISDVPDQINNVIKRLLADEPSLRPAVPELYEVFSHYLLKEVIETPYYNVRLPITGFVRNSELIDNLFQLKGGTAVVTGDMGSGKTRLLKELKYEFLFRDYEVFFYTGEKPFHDTLCNYVGFKDIDFSHKEDKYQVYAEITERVLMYGKNKKLVIVVDDLDNLGDYELGLFRYIGHSLKGTSISMLGAGKSDPRIKNLNFFELFLNPFSIQEIKELVDKTFFQIGVKGEKDLTWFIQWLYQHSGGNPLFITEILKTLYNENVLYYISNKWEIDTELLKKIKIPGQIEEIIYQRLRGLNPEEAKLLKVLALTDCLLELRTLQKIISAQVEVELEVLKMLGLIREEHINGKRFFSLSNQIIKIILEAEIKNVEATGIIKKIISAIEEMKPMDKSFYPVLARLCERIDYKEKTFRYFLISAETAEESKDYKDAIEYYKKILTWAKELEPGHYLEFLLNMAELYFKIGDNQNAIEYYKGVIEKSNNLLKIKSLSGMGKVYSTTGEHNLAIQYLQKALNNIKDKKTKEYIEINNCLAYSMTYLNDLDKAEKLLMESFAIAREIKDYESEAEAMYYSASLEWFRNEFEKGKEICQNLIAFCEKHKLNKQYAYTTNLLSSFYIQTGDMEQGLKYIERAIKGFEQIRDTDAFVNALINQGLLYARKGNIFITQEIYIKALLNAFKTDNKSNWTIIFVNLAGIYEEAGRFDKALEHYENCLRIEPGSIYGNYGLAMVCLKMGDFDKAKHILEQKLIERHEILYIIGLATVYNIMGRKKDAEELLNNALEQLEKKDFEPSAITEVYLIVSVLFYEKGNYEKAIFYAEKLKNINYKSYRESLIAECMIHLGRFRLKNIDKIDINGDLKNLKEKGFMYDYALLKRLYIEAIIDTGFEPEKTKEITQEIDTLEQNLASIGAELELQRTQKLKLKIYPILVSECSKGRISPQYLGIFSNLAELINTNLGDEDFVDNILDLVIKATSAERGAIFIKVDDKMEFIAGRNIDKKTIKDAGELSKTAIEEINKNKMVFVPNALEDPKFNIRKSVVLNQIRSILCMPLAIGENIVGAIYLDSKMIGSMFGEQDREFLLTTAKILASVIDKSRTFKRLTEELTQLRDGVVMEIGKGYILGRSRAIKEIYRLINDVGPSDSPVLITGETGVGKGMIARLIHYKSKRKDKKFVSINCGTIPETLLESELFGYKRGAFTGAVTDKKGLLEEGEAGTVFLDEITNTSPAFQAKMLEAIEDKIIRRLGETQTRSINVRFLFATNKDLEIEVEEGRFRRDLYYRINVFVIRIPSLRERIEDIPALAQFFLELKSKEMNKKIASFSPDAMRLLKEYPWPGNVRELQNVIERAVVLARSDFITPEDIGFHKTKAEISPLTEVKKDVLLEALSATNWNVKKAAQILGIGRRSLYRYFKKYKITRQK